MELLGDNCAACSSSIFDQFDNHYDTGMDAGYNCSDTRNGSGITCIQKRAALVIFASMNIVSILICIPGIILVLVRKLHKQLIYRLAMYQVIGSIMFSAVEGFQLVILDYDADPKIYSRICTSLGFFNFYTLWVTVLFSVSMTFHLFSFTVCYKNLKKCEPVYVVTSLVMPAIIAVVPLITGSYGRSPSWCWIRGTNDDGSAYITGAIEQLALWLVPVFSVVSLESTAVVWTLCVVSRRIYLSKEQSAHKKALYQVIPLASYPIILCVLILPVLVYRATSTHPLHPSAHYDLLLTTAVCIPLWTSASGVALITHMAVVLLCSKRRFITVRGHDEGTGLKIEDNNNSTPLVTLRSTTYFSLEESI